MAKPLSAINNRGLGQIGAATDIPERRHRMPGITKKLPDLLEDHQSLLRLYASNEIPSWIPRLFTILKS
jgi:hypothetical protein